jgi:hypothetical protein
MKVWLTPERIRFYAWPFFILNFFGLIVSLWLAPTGLNAKGNAVPSDFISFWAAGKLALQGTPAAAFDHASLQAASHLAIPEFMNFMPWHYPPLFLLVVTPFALLPYQASALAFLTVTLAPLLAILRRHWLLLLAAPATGSTLLHGQNGFLLSAILAGGLLTLSARPFLAGLFLSLLTFKPHIAVLLPILLLVTANFRALAGFAIGAGIFLSASLMAFGLKPWEAFIANIASANTIMETGLIEHVKYTSTFAALRLLGLSSEVAWAGHILVATIALYFIVRIWRRTSDTLLRAAATPIAILLITPHQFSYDMELLVLTSIFWLQLANARWQPYEQMTMALIWLLPLITLSGALLLNLQTAPVILLAGLILLDRRTKPLAA